MKNKRHSYPLQKVIFRVIPLQYKTVPWLMTISNLFVAIQSLAFTATVITTQILFDTVIGAVDGRFSFWDCVSALLLLVGATVSQQIFNGLYWFCVDVVQEKAAGKLKGLLHKKLRHIDPVSFESASFLDDLDKGNQGVYTITYFCMLFFSVFFFYLIYFFSTGVYLFQLKPVLVVSLLLSFIPAMFAQVVHGKVFAQLEEQSAPLRRENDYYRQAICDRDYFKETRLLGAFTFFYKLFSKTLELLTRKTWLAERKTAFWQLLMNSTTFGGMAVSVWLLYTAAMAGEISVGAFAAVFASLGQLFGLMQEMITWHMGNMSRQIGQVSNFLKVLDMPKRSGVESRPDFADGVVAKHISFTYPGRDQPAVDNVSLTIRLGETIALVGENGAGKTTLVRLLTGIYHPDQGRVTIGKQDTSLITMTSLFQSVSGVFQKFQKYKMTVKENIVISDTKKEADVSRIKTAMQEADVVLERNFTWDQMLSPEFGGTDLSGGQWQRLAIARGLYRTHDFIVLDEPTSAIDPIEETRIYNQFQQLALGKCAVVVTHRLGSVKLAHRVIVMESGKIVDSGTHDELLTRPGKYADMWEAQAQWY